MKFLLLNQTFYPDVMATGQYLQQVALDLVRRGHQVTVVTSRRAYDHPEKRFPKIETWQGIRIYRVASTGFGKTAKWRRATDFATFFLCCLLRLALLPRHDAILALTSPPLISFLGAWLAKLRRCRFFYWVMDLNPDEAIAAGWLRRDSLLGKVLESMSRFSFRRATKIIALDRFMRDRIAAKGIRPEKIAIIAPWPLDDEVRFDPKGRERFREAHGLEGKFVVMYSGNHSPCHPLDTLLDAAHQLRQDPTVVFCFVGGGSEFRKIQQLARADSVPGPISRVQAEPVGDSLPIPAAATAGGDGSGRRLSATLEAVAPTRSAFSAPPRAGNLLCLPYQPLNQLSASLSAADLHVVVMGNAFVGIVHPCKIYNILSVNAPVLYIGPRPSHLSELLDAFQDHYLCGAARHGETERVLELIERVRRETSAQPLPERIPSRCSNRAALGTLIAVLEST